MCAHIAQNQEKIKDTYFYDGPGVKKTGVFKTFSSIFTGVNAKAQGAVVSIALGRLIGS
jgi:hypothetical protein